MRRLIVTATAEAEPLDAAQWYQDRGEQLAVEFLLNTEAAFDAAQRRPNSFPLAYRGLRRVLLSRAENDKNRRRPAHRAEHARSRG